MVLPIAGEFGSTMIILLLLLLGIIMLVYHIYNTFLQSGQGDTALIVACYNGHSDIARILLDLGATIDYKNWVRSI